VLGGGTSQALSDYAISAGVAQGILSGNPRPLLSLIQNPEAAAGVGIRTSLAGLTGGLSYIPGVAGAASAVGQVAEQIPAQIGTALAGAGGAVAGAVSSIGDAIGGLFGGGRDTTNRAQGLGPGAVYYRADGVLMVADGHDGGFPAPPGTAFLPDDTHHDAGALVPPLPGGTLAWLAAQAKLYGVTYNAAPAPTLGGASPAPLRPTAVLP
jgi:hypothetical protein